MHTVVFFSRGCASVVFTPNTIQYSTHADDDLAHDAPRGGFHGPYPHPPQQPPPLEEEETLPLHPYPATTAGDGSGGGGGGGGGGGLVLCNAQASEDVSDFYRRDNPLIRFNRAGALGARCLPPAW